MRDSGSGTGGTGNVIGPSSVSDGEIATFDGSTGKLIEGSGIFLSDLVTITSRPRWTIAAVLIKDEGTPYVKTAQTTYQTFARILWPGTDNAVAITKVFVSAFKQSAGAMSVRIRDLTNGLTIVEKTGIVETNPDISTNLGTVSNLSTGLATWALQAKKDSGNEARVSGFMSY